LSFKVGQLAISELIEFLPFSLFVRELFQSTFSSDGFRKGCICLVHMNDTYAVDSLALSAVALAPMSREDVTHVRTTIIAAHLVVLPHSDMWLRTRVITFRICIPACILKLGCHGVKREFACTAGEVTRLGEEATVLSCAVTLCATLSQHMVLLSSQLRSPLLFGSLERIIMSVTHTTRVSHAIS
jgi:hypothetical protein